MKYYVELGCEINNIRTGKVMVHTFQLYPLKQGEFLLSETDVELCASSLEDDTGYVVNI